MSKIKNNQIPQKVLKNTVDESVLYKEYNTVIDFSFDGAFVSCKCNDFDNYLKDEKDFIGMFRQLMKDVQALSGHRLSELINGVGFRHCHKISDESSRRAKRIILEIMDTMNKDSSYYDQLIAGEDMFQLGMNSPIRLFGTVQGNSFRVYSIDYHHDFEYDQRKNRRNARNYSFCPMTADI